MECSGVSRSLHFHICWPIQWVSDFQKKIDVKKTMSSVGRPWETHLRDMSRTEMFQWNDWRVSFTAARRWIRFPGEQQRMKNTEFPHYISLLEAATPNWQQLSIVNSYPALPNTWTSFLWRCRFCVRAPGPCTELVCILRVAVQVAVLPWFNLCTTGCFVLVVSLTVFINCLNYRSMKCQ